MRISFRIAALLIGSLAFVGCDKDNSTPATPATPAVTPPAVPATPSTSAIDKAVDKGAAVTKDALNKLSPTTVPAIPGLGH